MICSRLVSLRGALRLPSGVRWREWRSAVGWVMGSWRRPAGASSHWEQRVAKSMSVGRRAMGAGEGA
jgi:hypothetical protein